MGYVPQHALDNLKKYSYKGVDKSVHPTRPLFPAPLTALLPAQIARVALCPATVLGLVRHPLANFGRAQHRTHPPHSLSREIYQAHRSP